MQATGNSEQSALAPLSKGALLLITIAAAAATFMEILDITIANVSIPTIAGSLGVAPNQGTWIISAYSIAAAISIPLTGLFARRFGEIRLFVFSVLAFTLFSTLAAMSVSLPMLVMCRVVQGFVSGPMVPLSQTLLARNFPPEKRGSALGLWALTLLLAPICGPLLGGYISNNYHWSWIFLINIPFGLLCGGIIWGVMRKRETPIVKVPLDLTGMILMLVGVSSLQLLLEIGKDHDWFASPLITSLGVVATVALTFFVAWSWHTPNTVVNLRLLMDRNFRYGVILLSVGYMTFFGSAVVLPLWLQTVMGYTSQEAGLALAPIGIFMLILGPIIGKNVTRLNLRVFATIAFLIMGAVSLWNSSMSLDAGYWDIARPRLAFGVGLAFFYIPIQTLMLWNVPPDQMASATGLANFLRTLGVALGTAISVTLWEQFGARHHAQLVEHISAFSADSTNYFDRLQGAGLSAEQSLALVDSTVNAQSYMLATNEFFLYSSVVFFAFSGLVWMTRQKKLAPSAG
jgi:DHA2 family multidrug resistance protein